jgi:hypothetical protein
MHVVMAIDSLRSFPIDTLELVELTGDDVLERMREPGVIHYLCEATPPS